MKLYVKLISPIARDIVHALMDNRDIDVEENNIVAARSDFEAIFKEYIRAERELSNAAKDIMASRGWSSSKYGEAKKLAASSHGLPLGEDALEYLTNQMLEYMFISPHFDEIYSEDHVMRKRMVDILRRYLKINHEVDEEVRRRLKHLQEGTRDWDIAYSKTLEEVQRAKGLV